MIALKDLLPSALRDLQTPRPLEHGELRSHWPAIVGGPLARRTRPHLTARGDLYVWTEESALAFELSRRYSRAVLRRVQAVMGPEAVKTIRFRVGQIHR